MKNIFLANIKQLNTIPDDYLKLLIARKPYPFKTKLKHVISLAPSKELFFNIKSNKITWQDYVFAYRREILNKQNVIDKIINHNNINVVLLCYCEHKQCHRYIVGNLFSELGYSVKEWKHD